MRVNQLPSQTLAYNIKGVDMIQKSLEQHIRCKCGKEYGVIKFRKETKCKRCQTLVFARGEVGNRK